MNRQLSFILVLIFCSVFLSHAKNDIAEKIKDKRVKFEFTLVSLFEVASPSIEEITANSDFLKAAAYLNFNQQKAAEIIFNRPENIILSIPMPEDKNLVLELTRTNFKTPDFSIHTSSGMNPNFDLNESLHYQGIISGDSLSICAISIFRNEVMGLISTVESGNIVLGRLKNQPEGLHILYNDRNITVSNRFECLMEEDVQGGQSNQVQQITASSVNCIRLYWEINFDIFTDKGGLTNTTNFILGVFNQSATLYNNDGIPVQLSQLYIWDTPSPYTAGSGSTQLSIFQSTRTSFAGDLGHLIGYGSSGIAASISGICSSNIRYSQCYSGIHPSYQNIPTFSWTVGVVTHEQGHLMGSRHTHACVWNGNNTAIDNCGPTSGFPYEGSCSGAPTPANGGTIMSYCQNTSTGINFALGFGPQPTAVILNNYNNGSCLTACTGGTFCGACSDLQYSNLTTNSVSLSWSPAINAISYLVQYRVSGGTVWLSDTTSNTGYLLSGLQDGTTYEWQVQTVCSGSSSLFTSSAFFITVPLVCSIPTGITVSSISSVSAALSWQAVNAAIRYIINYRPVGTTTWMSDSTSNTSKTISHLISNTNYEFRIQTVCAGEGQSGYSVNSTFVTLMAGTPVSISIQLDPVCGKDAVVVSNATTGDDYRNFGGTPEMNALTWTNSGNQVTHRSLIQFDMSFIPKGSGVLDAKLSLFWNTNSSNPGHSTLSGPNNGVLYKIVQPWEENTVTWINQPGTTTLDSVPLPASVSSSQNYLNIDVTNMMQDFVDDPENDFGMMLELANESAYRSLIFSSSDHPNSSLHPILEITYAPNVEPCFSYTYSNCFGVDALIGNSIPAGYANSNYGDNPEFDALAWSNSGQRSDLRTMIYWDLNDIPSNAIVTHADLSLFWNPVSSTPGHSNTSGPNDASLIRISSQWDEHTVTWNTQPTLDTSLKVMVPASSNNQEDYIIDITTLAQEMVSNPANNHGLMFKLNDENQYRSLMFCSSDHPEPARRPKIEICYTIPTGITTTQRFEDFIVSYDQSKEMVNVLCSQGFKLGTELTIYNLAGKTLKQFNISNQVKYTFSSSGMASGIYFISTDYSGNRITKKLVLN